MVFYDDKVEVFVLEMSFFGIKMGYFQYKSQIFLLYEWILKNFRQSGKDYYVFQNLDMSFED